MKIILHKSLALLFVLLSFGMVYSQGAYSGTIEMVTTDNVLGDRSNVKLLIKGQKSRVDIVSQTKDGRSEFSILANAGAPGLTMLSEMGGRKISMSLPDPIPGGSHSYPVFSQVWPESGSKMIAGVEAKKYNLNGNGNSATAWVAVIPGLTNADIPSGITFNGIMPMLKANGIEGIPLEYVINSNDGGVVVSQKAVSVRTETHSESSFTVPEGFEDGNKIMQQSAAGK